MVRDITHQGKERRGEERERRGEVWRGGREEEGGRKKEEGSGGEAMFTLLKTVLL